jgi:prolyl oligopeptidase
MVGSSPYLCDDRPAMPRTRAAAAAIAVIALTTGCGGTQAGRLSYPATRVVDAVDDYHGTKIADPYRWLEDLESQEVRDWAAAQTAIAEPFQRRNDVRPWILARVAELEQFWAEDESAGEPDEAPLIDEDTLGTGKTLSGIWPSPNGAFAVYAVSDRGSEWVETRIRRMSDGKDLDERLDGLLWSDALWTKDNRGFFYVRSVRPAPDERVLLKGPAVYYHVVGTPQSADVALFQTPRDASDLVLIQEMSGDGRYLFISEGNGAHVDEIGWLLSRMFVLDLGNPQRPALSTPLLPLTQARDAAYRVVASAGKTLYVFTDRNAPRRRVVAVNLDDPSPERWRDVVPQTDDVIDQVYDINGRFVVQYLRNVQHGVRVVDRTGRVVRELPIPPMTTVTAVRAGTGADEVVIEAMEGGFAPARSRHNVVTGAVTVERAAKLPFAAGEYEAKLVWYPSKDGVRVPMFVLHRRGLALDGSHPTFLVGYGASSQLTLPWFGDWSVAILELGMVVALPALRGGGELGRDWYEAGILERKQKSFDDFIAAAEYLIRERYTSPEKLAIQGASNGGLLVTAVINQRPELFRAVVAEVPQTDALRYDRGRHTAQFGTAKNPAQFPFLLAYSPQHNINPGTCYPATLVTTTLNDDRAPAWMAMKYAATLQAAQGCDRPIILRAVTGGGHSGNALDDPADAVAFVAGQLGVTVPVRKGR